MNILSFTSVFQYQLECINFISTYICMNVIISSELVSEMVWILSKSPSYCVGHGWNFIITPRPSFTQPFHWVRYFNPGIFLLIILISFILLCYAYKQTGMKQNLKLLDSFLRCKKINYKCTVSVWWLESWSWINWNWETDWNHINLSKCYEIFLLF